MRLGIVAGLLLLAACSSGSKSVYVDAGRPAVGAYNKTAFYEVGAGQSALVLQHRERLPSSFYGSLLDLAERQEKTGQTLGAIACYRALTDQIRDEVAARRIGMPSDTSNAWSGSTVR